ncbi:phosphoribosylamine--glycine ligase [bacterium]|nr:phosphoribosylamine--glycine ligase [bacterium]
MRIMIIGSGGREHAIAWSLKRSKANPTLFVAPGNGGTDGIATNVNLDASNHVEVIDFVTRNDISLVIIGPEQPLVDGLADALREKQILVVGPSALAAQLEGSKAFSKAFMKRNGIPTASFETFTTSQWEAANQFLQDEGAPIVIKASGLAAGKGAVVCMTLPEAEATLSGMLLQNSLGSAGSEVVIESFMEGEEVSVFVLTDGTSYQTLAPAQDHKRIGEGDTGPNTGGMGAYAPAPVLTSALYDDVCRTIIEPTLEGMKKEGYPFQGFLYVGLMITKEGPKVVEYNCRLGDPETQVVLPLMKTDAQDVFLAMAKGELDQLKIESRTGAAACVVMASQGYPGSYEKGKRITGIKNFGLDVPPGEVLDSTGFVEVFHAGTQIGQDGGLTTSGGRVLAVSAFAETLSQALDLAYERVERIEFEGAQFRRDIGQKGLARQ